MKGRRISWEDALQMLMEPGDYAGPGPTGPVQGHWLICTPSGHSGRLSPTIHHIVEHEDRTITVSPSIRVSLPQGDNRPAIELWHGYLERGVWRQV